MAQTRRKRKTKHRGNAAGIVEVRGRTGRPPSAEERKRAAKTDARTQRIERMTRPPTWRGAVNRAAIATIVFAVLVVAAFGQSVAQASALAAFMLVIYIPLGYYTDLALYKRRAKILGRAGSKRS